MEGLSEDFLTFIAANGIPRDAYDIATLSRFFRINPRNRVDVATVTAELDATDDGNGLRPEPVPWLEGFYRLPATAPLAALPCYKSGKVFGIDVSSAAAVKALGVEPGDNVLDLCCAPGAKLCMIGDELRQQGSITGVDVSETRLSVCRTMCKKYDVKNVRLFAEDASTFAFLAPRKPQDSEDSNIELPPLKKFKVDEGFAVARRGEPLVEPMSTNSATSVDASAEKAVNSEAAEALPFDSLAESFGLSLEASDVEPDARSEVSVAPPSRKRKRSKVKNKKKFQGDPPNLFFCNAFPIRRSGVGLYDKVLLDAQCSLDAAIRHVLQFKKVGWQKFDHNVDARMAALQKRLLFNAYRLLRPGGVLVYSTCSFSTNQNEDVVAWLLAEFPSQVVLEEIHCLADSPAVQGRLALTKRFYPRDTNTSGLFIARLRKLQFDTSKTS